MRFNEVLTSIDYETGEATIPESWGQGRATFGGLIVAMLYSFIESKADSSQLIRSIAVSFVGPAPKGPVTLSAKKLRQGKNVSQWSGEMIADGEIVLSLLASFGTDRDSYVQVASEPPAEFTPPEALQEFPYLEGITPEFTQHYDYRWAVGDFPFSNSKKRNMGGWIKSKQEQKSLSATDILGFVDAWPPAVLSLLKAPAPGSSLTWTIEFIQPMTDQTTDQWFQYDAHIEHASNGYGHFSANLYDRKGHLVAISRQSVVVFG